jgi:hypothetical protein
MSPFDHLDLLAETVFAREHGNEVAG